MADTTPPGPNEPEYPPKRKKSSWLSTSDWLGMSKEEPLPEGDAALPLGLDEAEQRKFSGPPSSKIIAHSDLVELTAAPADEDDDEEAIDLATPPGGATTGPPSLSKILKATGTKSDILRSQPKSDDSNEAMEFTPAAPASGWLGGSKIPAPRTGGSRTDIGGSPRISDETSDIFSGARSDAGPASETGSHLLPGLSGVGRSSVFNDPSRAGSSGIAVGAESDLFGGLTAATDRGSSLYDDSAKKTLKVPRTRDDEDAFQGAKPGEDGGEPSDIVPLMGQEMLDDFQELGGRPADAGPLSSVKLTDRLLAGLADSGGMSRPDYNATDKTAAGSNLFDDVTAMDIDLGADPGDSSSRLSGGSGVNWADPNRAGAQDSEAGSSIFMKPPADEKGTDPGRVDFSKIPMMGSTDDPHDMVKPGDLAGPESSVLKKEIEKAMAELNAGGEVSFDMPHSEADRREAWGTAKMSYNDQMSMRMPAVDEDELDLAAPSQSNLGKPQSRKSNPRKESDSVFDEVVHLPDESGVLVRHSGSISGSILQGMTEDKLKYHTEAAADLASKGRPQGKPSSKQLIDLDAKASPRAKGGIGIMAGLGLLALGTAAGAVGMYFGKPAEKTTQTVAAADPQVALLKQKAEESTKEAEKAKADLVDETAAKTAAEKNVARLTEEVKSVHAQFLKALALSAEVDKHNAAMLERDKMIAKLDKSLETESKARSKAENELKTLKANAETAKSEMADNAKKLEIAMAAASEAADKLKVADGALDTLIAQLKAAKLIDEKATRDQAIAALPEASKKAVMAGGGTSEAATMAKELAAAKEKSQKELADAAAKIAALETAVKDSEAKIKAEVAKANQASREEVQKASEKLAEAQLALKKEKLNVEEKLREQAEAHQQQMAAVRAGAAVAISDSERSAHDLADRAYGDGLNAYTAGRYSQAETFLKRAIDKNPNDARYWYFLGLAKWNQGRSSDAVADFKKGHALESRGLPGGSTVSLELIRIQGPARQALDAERP